MTPENKLEILRRSGHALRLNIAHAMKLDAEEGVRFCLFSTLDLTIKAMIMSCKENCKADSAAAAKCVLDVIVTILNENDEGAVFVTEGTLPEILEAIAGTEDAQNKTKH